MLEAHPREFPPSLPTNRRNCSTLVGQFSNVGPSEENWCRDKFPTRHQGLAYRVPTSCLNRKLFFFIFFTDFFFGVLLFLREFFWGFSDVRCLELRGNDFKTGLSNFEAIFEDLGPKYKKKSTLLPQLVKLVPVI